MLNIEVVYIPENGTPIRAYVNFEPGLTVAEVLNRSGLHEKYPEIKNLSFGIFSKQVSLEIPVQANDRIEIYRPLLMDPKERRRLRAKKHK